MMERQDVEGSLKQAKDRLREIERERTALLRMIEGLEGYLSVLPMGRQITLPGVANGRRASSVKPKGTVSFRSAVAEVLRQAAGAELTSEEILRRAQDMGAVTAAKNPVGVVDLSLLEQMRGNPHIQKTKPRTFRWAE